jgi:DNA repair protein RadC
MHSTTIKKLAQDDRPREKALKYGFYSLAEAELLAILLRSGTRNESALELARRIYAEAGNNLHNLARLSVRRLQSFKGVGEAKAITLAAALELGRRRMHLDRTKEPKITRSADVYDLMAPYLVDKCHEEVWIVLMNQAGTVVHHVRVSSGGMTGTVVDPKIVMRYALEYHATRMILVHNHPSGSTRPSRQDIALTQKIKQGADLLDVELTDHIIVGGDRYYSFLDEGML